MGSVLYTGSAHGVSCAGDLAWPALLGTGAPIAVFQSRTSTADRARFWDQRVYPKSRIHARLDEAQRSVSADCACRTIRASIF